MINTAIAKSQYEQGGTPRTQPPSEGQLALVAGGHQMAVRGGVPPPPPPGGMVARPQGMQMQAQIQPGSVALQDPAVQKHLREAGKGGDGRYDQGSISMIKQMSMARALGGPIGVAVNMDTNSTQGSWMNLVRKSGRLVCKMENGQWDTLTFFCYNGFFAACHLGGEDEVGLRTLNVTQIALSNYQGVVLPLPLQGCKIFAQDGNTDFSLQFPLPMHQGQPASTKQLDLKAETNEAREQWIEEIYKAIHLTKVGDEVHSVYVPRSMRDKSPAEQVAASQQVKPSKIDEFKKQVGNSYNLVQGKVAGGSRACMDAGNDCMLM